MSFFALSIHRKTRKRFQIRLGLEPALLRLESLDNDGEGSIFALNFAQFTSIKPRGGVIYCKTNFHVNRSAKSQSDDLTASNFKDFASSTKLRSALALKCESF
jgi:hypothetical protein